MEIYDRQIRVFGTEGQRILQGLTVGIVGAGGIGSLVFLLLVRLGVGRLILLDPDVVELSNLNRLAGATLEDATKQRPKVDVLARYAARINPAVTVIAFRKSILEEKAREHLKGCDVMFGCTDNQSSRWVLNQWAVEHAVPYFDTGTGITAGPNQAIERAGGQVRVVIPGMGCLNCIGGIKIDIAQQEMLPESDRNVAIQLGYIAGADIKAPAVASLNDTIASLAVTEFMAFVTGFRPVQRFVGYNFLSATVLPYTFPRDPNCFTCSSVGSLALGDAGIPLPVELLLDEPQPQNQGAVVMNNETRNIQSAITELLSHAAQERLPVEGHAENRWLLLRRVKLGSGFNRPAANVMIKFFGNDGDPIVFVPDKIQIKEAAPVCPNFIVPTPCLKGWKALCPHMFQDVGDELLPFIACLCGFLANPALCGCMGCAGKSRVAQEHESRESREARAAHPVPEEATEQVNSDVGTLCSETEGT
jgi:molybdopterin/thiamine biosynthesis adenylyltransferase